MADWHLKGTVVLACNCEPGCPCNFNALPTHGDCEGGWDWHIEEGRYGDADLAGLNFSLYCDWPGAIHEGNGEAVTFVDERADERQREALETLLGGKVGGPWGILVTNTVTTMHGPHAVPYEVELAEQRSRVRVGDAHVLELEPIKNPVSGAETHPRAVLPEGMIFKDGAIALEHVLGPGRCLVRPLGSVRGCRAVRVQRALTAGARGERRGWPRGSARGTASCVPRAGR